MNRKGQLALVSVMISFILIVTIVVLLEPFKGQVSDARTSLDCDNSSLTTEEEMTCIIVGFSLPAWVGIAFAVALGFVGASRLIKESD